LYQLSAAGKTVKLEPKAMTALVYLAHRPGQVVSREALLSAVWPDVIVGDDSLTQVVIKLRKALGDAAETPAFIQTIAKGGYRLVAPVVWSAEISERKRRFPWRVAAGMASLLIAAAGAWWIKSERAPSGASSEAARMTQPTIAISAFEALGNDPKEALLARGITADLVTDLSKLSGLRVIGFSPVERSAEGEAPRGAAAARYLLSGTVQRVDERLRLQIYLADAKTGQQLWSERFDRTLSDLFAIQDELGLKIVQLLPAKVSKAEILRMAQRDTRSLEAYEYFQRGQAALLIRQRSDNETAREMFRRAIGLDAAFARAYAGLALTYAADYRNQWSANGVAALDRAFETARTARQINPDIAETYWALASVHLLRHEPEHALEHLQTAVHLSPSFADGYALMGSVKTFVGRPADTVPLVRTAMRLNPASGSLYFLVLGRAYLFLGDLEQAQLNLEQALLRNAESLEAHIYLAALHVAAGNDSLASWEADQIRVLQPGFSVHRWLETYPMTDVAQKTKLARALGGLGF
jgi:TolB-like protein/DNA-binding winged helix-turn-helix (wHTH) protein/Tfp pilus assembly protein PilF